MSSAQGSSSARTECRICGATSLIPRIDFGALAPCGVFASMQEGVTGVSILSGKETKLTYGDVLPILPKRPLAVVQCPSCDLIQLAHDAPVDESFNPATFGYRSGTNVGMVRHLEGLADRLHALLSPGDLVIDIGSNDGTFLNFLHPDLIRVGVDPVAGRFLAEYDGMTSHQAFWGGAVASEYKGRANAICAFACLYDLPDPNAFMAAVASALAPEGFFLCEVAYGLTTESWDIVSHEHLEYYHLKPLRLLLARHGLVINEIEYTSTQGGSILFTARKGTREAGAHRPGFNAPENDEAHVDWAHHFSRLRRRIASQCQDVWRFLDHAPAVRLHGLCASTKGNTLLQVFGLTRDQIPLISDANPDKWGRLTPGTSIPIISEAESRALEPDYYFVLSHQFADGLKARELLAADLEHRNLPDFIVPLPNLVIR